MNVVKRVKCIRCGAKTEKQADKICKPIEWPSGDSECPASYLEVKNGWFVSTTKTQKGAGDE